MGSTNPKEAKPGTIRNLYAISIDKILCMVQTQLKMLKLKLIIL